MLSYAVRAVLLQTRHRKQHYDFWKRFRVVVVHCAWPAGTECSGWATSYIGSSDRDALSFLKSQAGPGSKRMIGRILNREIYQRIAVLSHGRSTAQYDAVYERFRSSRLSGDHAAIETERARVEDEIV